MSKKVVLKIDNLSYAYKAGSFALENVNIEIYENDFVAIIGQNGAGKSTLLKNITGLLRPTEGAIYVNGKDNKDMTIADISKEIGFVLQNPDRQLFADNVYEEVAYGLRNAGMKEEDIKVRVEETLQAVGLADKKEDYPPALSKGDRAKVVIACVIAMQPGIIILDEPTSGQDFKGCYQIMDIAKAMHKLGHTIIFVTHHMPLVTEYADRTIVMARKKVLMDGYSHDVFNHPEELATTNIKPPQITQFGSMLSEFIPLEHTMLSVEELGDALLKLQK
ncbi:MAG: ATP-binding cassette domain-containing protein [Oscillospiraceae bacterium]|nr:ATP-binding cassette domain-containing protein [Oscillospiraceae bacterium]